MTHNRIQYCKINRISIYSLFRCYLYNKQTFWYQHDYNCLLNTVALLLNAFGYFQFQDKLDLNWDILIVVKPLDVKGFLVQGVPKKFIPTK